MTWDTLEVPVPRASLSAQSMGRPAAPAVLLLGGATWSRDWWDDSLCEALAAQGFRVVRHDPRDTGQSTLSPPGTPDYDADDLAADAVAVLDAFGVDSAILVGLSMGGGLAQSIAARHRRRVAGLVLVSTSPAGPVDVELPGPEPRVVAAFSAPPAEPDWTDREAALDHVVAVQQPFSGPGCAEEPWLREVAGRTFDRCVSMSSASNHDLVAAGGAAVDMVALRGIPAAVVHGSADPLFPLPHGAALASWFRTPLRVLGGVGHQAPPRAHWPTLIEAIQSVS